MGLSSSNERPPLPAATASLVLANFALYGAVVLLAALRGPDLAVRWYASMGLVPAAITWYSPFTYSLLHGSVLHLSVNMLLLWVFGCPLESALGGRRFVAAYLLAGVPVGLLQGLLGAQFPGADRYALIIGASGTVATLAGLYTVRFYRERVSLGAFPLQVPAALPIAIVAVAEMVAIAGVFVLRRPELGSGAAHLAHVGGFGLGLLVGQVLHLDQRAHDDYRASDARVDIGQGAPFRAVRRWRRAVEMTPADGGVLVELGRACLAAGDCDEATAAYTRAVVALLAIGNKRDAIVAYFELHDATGVSALAGAARLAVSAALDEQGRHQEAITVLEALLADDPGGPESEMAELRRATIRYRGLADSAGAVTLLATFLAAHPGSQWSDYARQLIREIEAESPGAGA